jgi:hypothetical protein
MPTLSLHRPIDQPRHNHAMDWKHCLSALANAAASLTAIAGPAVDVS